MDEERRRILDLLANDKISVDQAEGLLRALAADRQPPPPPAAPGVASGTPAKGARSIQIQIHEEGSGKNVNVTVPIGLIRFAGRFLPSSARDQLADNGIQLDDLIASLESPELLAAGSTLVEVKSEDEDMNTSTIHIKAV